MATSKKYKEALKLIDKTKAYAPKEAMEAVVSTSKAKFDETVELHVKLGVDGRNADQQVRGVCVLPEGTGKTVRVLVITRGDKAEEARKAGADIVGDDDVIAKFMGGWLDFDVCITTPDMMGAIGRCARILGPKGLMPNPKSGTVTMDVTKAINDVKAGKVEYRLDKQNIIHVRIGKVSFGAERLLNNLTTVMDAIVKAKPASAKGVYLKSVYVATTMGPSVKLSYDVK